MKTLCGIVALAASASMANAALIASVVSAANSGTLFGTAGVPEVSNVRISRGSGLSNNTGGSFNSRDWEEGTSEASAVAAGNFLLFQFDVVDMAIDLTSMDIRYDRSNTGPSNLALQLSVDGGAFSTFFTDTVSASGENQAGIALSGEASSSVQIRIVGWGASSSSGTFDIENNSGFGNNAIRVFGDVVPTPGSAALLGVAGVAAARRRRA